MKLSCVMCTCPVSGLKASCWCEQLNPEASAWQPLATPGLLLLHDLYVQKIRLCKGPDQWKQWWKHQIAIRLWGQNSGIWVNTRLKPFVKTTIVGWLCHRQNSTSPMSLICSVWGRTGLGQSSSGNLCEGRAMSTCPKTVSWGCFCAEGALVLDQHWSHHHGQPKNVEDLVKPIETTNGRTQEQIAGTLANMCSTTCQELAKPALNSEMRLNVLPLSTAATSAVLPKPRAKPAESWRLIWQLQLGLSWTKRFVETDPCWERLSSLPLRLQDLLSTLATYPTGPSEASRNNMAQHPGSRTLQWSKWREMNWDCIYHMIIWCDHTLPTNHSHVFLGLSTFFSWVLFGISQTQTPKPTPPCGSGCSRSWRRISCGPQSGSLAKAQLAN